jgi:hypothetical protein
MRRYAFSLLAVLTICATPAFAVEQCGEASGGDIPAADHSYCDIFARQAAFLANSAAYTEQMDTRRAAYLAPMLAAEQAAANGGGLGVSAGFAAGEGDPLAAHEAAVEAAVDSGLTLPPEAEGPASDDVVPVP